jgi:hypothetical protein
MALKKTKSWLEYVVNVLKTSKIDELVKGGHTMVESNLTCPECSHIQSIEMPTDYCLFFHQCNNCKITLKPKKGDCCVFCSYGDKLCPPKGGC